MVAIVAVIYLATTFMVGSTYSVSLELAYTPTANLFPYNTTRFAIIVNNTGSAYIYGMLVGFYVNGQAFHNYNVSIPQGKAATILVNFTYPQEGNYSFEAIVDPGHLSRLSSYNGTQLTMYAHVHNATRPDPLSSLPDNGITSSSTFNFLGGSMAVATLMYGSYNTLLTNQIFLPSHGIMYGLIKDIYQELNGSYGALASYSDGSVAESLWLQGLFGVSDLQQVIQSYGPKMVKSGQYSVFYMPGNTTLCLSYSGGWTKLLLYSSGRAACASIGAANATAQLLEQDYMPSFSANSPIMRRSANFTYLNSTVVATQYGLSNGSAYLATWFTTANNIFISYVNESPSWPLYQNRTCYGLISNGVVCSEYILPLINSTTTKSSAMILSREIAGNYLFSLYSWVDNQSSLDANFNAAKLLAAVTSNETALKWRSAYRDICSFNSTYGIGCNVTSFDGSTYTASVTLSNLANESMRVNSASCYTPGLQNNETVNRTIAAHGALNFSLTCHYSVLLPAIGIQNSYLFYLNYTRVGRPFKIIGFLNTSNII